ncbi:hypothetical protein E0H77_04030 [Acinetobacter sp. ANC 4633]|uniref:MCR_0457 family protein n=1 Tax=Acinetobacter sp. ANC 4633 TaxID=2529845 RepID=UPI00103B05D8|nr:hypothetical protein [Acinetobacter sp. ANC 4633]TCB27862.1 hypothetical protein E0H77_04030 [Acinetobacter sp. ANC 4633]
MIYFAKRFFCATFALSMMLSASANSDLTIEEQNSLTKGDLASLQVLSELCHQIIDKRPQFQQNMQRLIDQNQRILSRSTSVQELPQDHEYQSLLAESKSNSQEMSQPELKAACEEVLNAQ